MDIDLLMTLVIVALGLALYATRHETDKYGARAGYGLATLVIAILMCAALVADAVLVMMGAEHVAAWRVSRTYIRGVVGLIGMLALVPMLVVAVMHMRKQPPA